MKLFYKQKESFKNSNRRLNIWHGSVSSGKTFISILKWIEFIITSNNGDLIMIGRTTRSVERNIINPLILLLGSDFKYHRSLGYCVYNKRKIYVEGANNSLAENKIRGMTLMGAYIDEITLIDEDMFKMTLSRLRLPGAKLFGSTNPDSPYHYLKTEYIDNSELDSSIFHFHIDDNTFLPKEYVQEIKKEYRGLFYKRFIDGLWCLAEGTIYDFFDENEHTITECPYANNYYISIDYGTSAPCVFLLCGVNKKSPITHWIEKEYYWDSNEHNCQKTDSEYVEDLLKFTKDIKVSGIIVDPSATSFMTALNKKGIYNIIHADNDVNSGIKTQANKLYSGKYKIHVSCINTIKEYSAYIWDKKAQKKGIDSPLKQYDHTKDAERYFLYTLENYDLWKI